MAQAAVVRSEEGRELRIGRPIISTGSPRQKSSLPFFFNLQAGQHQPLPTRAPASERVRLRRDTALSVYLRGWGGGKQRFTGSTGGEQPRRGAATAASHSRGHNHTFTVAAAWGAAGGEIERAHKSPPVDRCSSIRPSSCSVHTTMRPPKKGGPSSLPSCRTCTQRTTGRGRRTV